MKKIFVLLLILPYFLINDLVIIHNINPDIKDNKHKVIEKVSHKKPRKGCKNGSLK